MSVRNRPWADVRTELFGEPYMVWHDGPEFSGLRDAWREEPEALLEQLFAGMEEDDPLASQSLAELEPAPTGEMLQKVIAMLEAHLPTSHPATRVQIGMALVRLTGDEKWARAVAQVLDGGASFWSDQIDAAMALRHIEPTPELRIALLHGVVDPEYLVRYHSANTLRHWNGLDGSVESDEAMFGDLTKDDDREAWQRVADRLAQP
jgi:hypothetical protein